MPENHYQGPAADTERLDEEILAKVGDPALSGLRERLPKATKYQQ